MTDERLSIVLDRIERAIARLESAGAARADDDLRHRFARLDERHRRLRARTAEAVDQLGLLLDSPQPPQGG